jgi:hypothetical protein
MISRVGDANNISLYPMEYYYKIAGGLNHPIASFQIRVLDTIGEKSQILAMSGELIIFSILSLIEFKSEYFLLSFDNFFRDILLPFCLLF